MKTKHRKPKKNHPWRRLNPVTSKPKSIGEIMAYVAENNHLRKHTLIHNKGEYL